eukprot:5010284-Ditylum_brightwellii.AAC.1
MGGHFTNPCRRSGKKGIKASRSGGSQGPCQFIDLMKKHLQNPGSFPIMQVAGWSSETPRLLTGLAPRAHTLSFMLC